MSPLTGCRSHQGQDFCLIHGCDPGVEKRPWHTRGAQQPFVVGMCKFLRSSFRDTILVCQKSSTTYKLRDAEQCSSLSEP